MAINNEIKLISLCLQTGLYGGDSIPVCIQGLPGVGKSAVIKQLCAEIEKYTHKPFPAEFFVASQRMVEEVGGVPVPIYDEKRLLCLPMKIFDEIMKAGGGCLVMDEYNLGPAAMGGALQTVITGNKAGDVELPQSMAKVVIINPPDCATNGRSMAAPESNRMCWVEWREDLESFISFTMGNKGLAGEGVHLPPDWEGKFLSKNNGLMLSFLRANPSVFNVKEHMPKAMDAGKPWPSPRSFTMMARLTAACEAVGQGPGSDLWYLAVAGTVGPGVADGFMDYVRKMDIPDPEIILKDPKKAEEVAAKLIPTDRIDKLTASLEALATAAVKEDHKLAMERYIAAWRICAPFMREKADACFWAAKILGGAVQKFKGCNSQLRDEFLMVAELLKTVGVKIDTK